VQGIPEGLSRRCAPFTCKEFLTAQPFARRTSGGPGGTRDEPTGLQDLPPIEGADRQALRLRRRRGSVVEGGIGGGHARKAAIIVWYSKIAGDSLTHSAW